MFRLVAALLAPLALLVAACTGNIIVKIDSEVITSADIQQALQMAARNYDAVELANPERASTLKARVVEQLIARRLVARAAATHGVSVSPPEVADYVAAHKGQYNDASFAAMLEEKRIDRQLWEQDLAEQLLTQKLIDAAILPTISITEAELRKFYQAHVTQYTRGEAVHVRQILLDSATRAKEIHAQITKGGNVAQLAVEHSISPEAAAGGDLGWIERGQFPKTMEAACFKLPTGAVSEVIHTEFGYHIFKVLERRSGTQLPLAAVKEEIKAELQQQRVQLAFAKLLEDLRAASTISVKEDALAKIPVAAP